MKRITIILTIAIALFQLSCDDEVILEPQISTYKGTQSPGDVWTWELDKVNGTIEMTWDAGSFGDTSDDVLINGTFEELPSGFIKATIQSSTPVSAEFPTDGSAFFYAVELENTALMVKPEGSIKGDIIMMVAEGDCADVAGDYNYIVTAPNNGSAFDPIVEEAFGNVTFTQSGSIFSIAGSKMSLDCLNNGPCSESGIINGLPSATCDGTGFVNIVEAGDITAEGQFASTGVMMLDFGLGNGGIYGLKQNNSINVNSFNGKSLNGIGYFPEEPTDKTIPVKAEFDNFGEGTAFLYDNLETNTVDSLETGTINFDSANNGLLIGKITHGSMNTTDFAAAAIEIGGKQLLILSSTTDQVGNPPFIIVLTTI